MSRGIISVTKLNINGVLIPAPNAEIKRPKSKIEKLGANALITLPTIKPPQATTNSCLAVKRSFKYDEQIIIIAMVKR